MGEHQQDAGVADRERRQLGSGHTPADQHRPEQQHEGRVEIEDEPFQAGRDVLEAREVQEARQVVAREPEPGHHLPVACRERRLAAPGPPGQRKEQRPCEQHAVHDEGHRIDAMAVGQLDDDGLAREGHGTSRGQQKTRADGVPRAPSGHEVALKPAAWPSRRGSLAAT